MKMNISKPRAFNRKRRTRQIWVDPEFKKFLDNQYPGVYDPEKTRRLLDRLLGYETRKK